MSPLLNSLPRLALTQGDVAGVGPEVVLRALQELEPLSFQPLIVGDVSIVRQAAELVGSSLRFEPVPAPSGTVTHSGSIPVWNPATVDLSGMVRGQHQACCGEAAYQWLVAATQAALRGEVEAIVTAPLSKAALHLAGHHYPGHTEILAEQCGVDEFAMMLHLPHGGPVQGVFGLSVAHVTLHTSIASVPNLLSSVRIQETIALIEGFVRQLGSRQPRIGVCALNPHAGEEGLFGDEESRLIAPAAQAAQVAGINAQGPFPADTLLLRATQGEFDGVVAMYHDQGHIALKLIGFRRAVNVTLGLPIIRTSPSHGTAFDIAWRGIADADGMRAAIGVALQMSANRTPVLLAE